MKNSFYISFGVWLIIISLLGVPIVWRDTLVALSGLFLISVSIGPAILKRLQTKPKLKKKPEPPKQELKFSDIPSPSQPVRPDHPPVPVRTGPGGGEEQG